MLFFPHISLLDLAVHVVAVRAVARRQVFFHSRSDGLGNSAHPHSIAHARGEVNEKTVLNPDAAPRIFNFGTAAYN
jgi:hypothetical protein